MDLLGNREIKRWPIGNQGSEKKKNSRSGKEMRMGVPVTVYGRNRTVSVSLGKVKLIIWVNPIGEVLTH